MNPNQLALLCGILALLALHLADTATTRAARVSAILCLIMPIWVGRMAGSDTFTLMLVAMGPVFLVMKLRSWLRNTGHVSLRAVIASLVVIALPFLLISMAPVAFSLAGNSERMAMSLAKDGGKDVSQEADLRLSLWHDALIGGLNSAMLGLGPGPHLKIPQSIVAARAATLDTPENLVHPTAGSAPNFEAHNTFLDLFTQGGLIAVLSVLWLQVKALSGVYKQQMAGLITLCVGLIIFEMTGLIIRHAVSWFSIALCLVEQRPSGASRDL